VGSHKVGFTYSSGVDINNHSVERYDQHYIRTIPTVAAVACVVYFWPILIPGGAAAGLQQVLQP
jgi:hypothetical protein